MSKPIPKPENGTPVAQPVTPNRRAFLQKAGLAGASAALFLTGCKNGFDEISDAAAVNPSSARTYATTIDLGTGDIGVLNYAYLLEQLEAAFYIQAVNTMGFMNQLSAIDRHALGEIRNHEIAHRDFFKAALGSSAIPEVTFDFSSINFINRNKVLLAARTFEDLGVAAYNGAGRLIETPAYLTLAGKIVSVEARHASFLREIYNNYARLGDNTAFAGDDIIDDNGLDLAYPPAQVLTAAAPFVQANISWNPM